MGAYIAGDDGVTRERLEAVRALLRGGTPEATEAMSSKMPVVRVGGHSVVFFAGYKRHIGMDPMPAGDATLQADLAPYCSGVSGARFPHKEPLPAELIERIVRRRLAELPRASR